MSRPEPIIDPTSRLPDLIALAQESSSEKRQFLLRELTDNFFGAANRSVAETALYGDVLTRLSQEMEEAVRAELAQRFGPSGQAPVTLIRHLAADESPTVAGAVLSASPLLTEADLLQVAAHRSQGHLRAMCARESVPEALSAAIVARADDQTLDVLLRNAGARLTRETCEAAVDRAKLNPVLHEATVTRADLPPDLLNEMYFLVESRLRQAILEQNARLDPVIVNLALAAGRSRIATQDGFLPPDYDEQLAYVQELKAAHQLSPPVLARFLRSGGRTAFLIALAELADIDFHTARDIIDRRELDALAVVCRAAGLDRALFLTYAVSLLNDDGDAMGKARGYAGLYAALERETAVRTLRFWRMRRAAA